MKSLLGYSFATSDVLEKYQQKLATTCSNVLFVQPTLYRILEESRSPPTDLCEKEFHKYEFVFWPINIGGTQKKGSEHWVAGVHSTNDKSKCSWYLGEYWSSTESYAPRFAPNSQFLFATANTAYISDRSAIAECSDPTRVQLWEHCQWAGEKIMWVFKTIFSNDPFEVSHILRIKQAKEIFDFVLQM